MNRGSVLLDFRISSESGNPFLQEKCVAVVLNQECTSRRIRSFVDAAVVLRTGSGVLGLNPDPTTHLSGPQFPHLQNGILPHRILLRIR